MILTPEQEVLVEAGAMLLSGDHPTSWERRPDNKKQLRELVRAGIVAPDTITRDDYRDDARAIIPLIYTAGRRAGREEAAAYVEGAGGVIPGAAVFAPLASGNNMPCMSGDPRERLPSHKRRAFDDATSALATSIRNLSEQESGR